MLTLSLTRRPAKIGKSINTRTEMHGEDEVPGLDIPITGLLINAEELGLLTDCPSAHDALFTSDTATGFVPRIPAIEVFHIDHKFENAMVRITGSTIEKQLFTAAKIKGIKLELQGGGLTLVSFTLQVNPDNGLDVPKLLNAKISIVVKSAELETSGDDQPDLPLDHGADDPGVFDTRAAHEDENEAESNIGRRMRRAAKKRERKDIDG